MEYFWMYVLFAVGIVLIVKGGDWFVDGAVWVAEVTGIPKFIIGATIVSIATTLPEIIVSTIAAVEGHEILRSGMENAVAASQDRVGMAIGNGIGSVICNTAMILAIGVIFMPIAIKRKDFTPKALLLTAAVTALFLLSLRGSLSLLGAFVLLAIFALYIAENLRSAKTADGGQPSTETVPATDKKIGDLQSFARCRGCGGYRCRLPAVGEKRREDRRFVGRVGSDYRRHDCRRRHLAAGACDSGYLDHQKAILHVHRQCDWCERD